MNCDLLISSRPADKMMLIGPAGRLGRPEMQSRIFALRLAVLLLLATGCSTTLTNTINPAPRATIGRDPASVEVYTAGPPVRPRVDVSLTWAELNSGPRADPFGTILDELRKQAGALGCDALIVQPTSASTIVATCAMYTDGAQSPITAPP